MRRVGRRVLKYTGVLLLAFAILWIFGSLLLYSIL